MTSASSAALSAAPAAAAPAAAPVDLAHTADLANLADIVLTAPPSWWPPAPGVWIVAAALVAALAVALWRCLRRYQANAFLRRASTELDAVAAGTWPDAAAMETAVSSILKRAALVVYGRGEVARLTGAAWREFLARTTPAGREPPRFTALPDALENLASAGPPADHTGALVAAARGWLHARRAQGGKSRQSGKEA